MARVGLRVNMTNIGQCTSCHKDADLEVVNNAGKVINYVCVKHGRDLYGERAVNTVISQHLQEQKEKRYA